MTRLLPPLILRRRSAPLLTLALLVGCQGPGAPAQPAPKITKSTPGTKAAPPETKAAPPETKAAPPETKAAPPAEQTPPATLQRAQVPLCDVASAAITQLRTLPADATAEQRGAAASDAALLELLAHTDTVTGRADKAGLAASEATAGDEIAAATLAPALAFWMRNRLADAADDKRPAGDRLASWDAAACAWEQLRTSAAVQLGIVARDPARASLPAQTFDDTHLPVADEFILSAFIRGREALTKPADAHKKELELILQPARQQIEKTFYRLVHRSVLAGARAGASEREQRLGLHAFALIEDRLKDKNTPGIARVKQALTDPSKRVPSGSVDIRRELNVAFAKRTRKYCSDALEHADRPLALRLASANEGATYMTLILPDMARQLAKDGFVVDEHRDDWRVFVELLEDAGELEGGTPDPDELARVSAELVRWNCAYQTTLGIRECTATVDERP